MPGASSEKEINRTAQTPDQGQDGLVPLGCVSGHLCQDPRKGPPSPPRPHRGPSPAGGCQPQAALWPAGGGWEPLGHSHVSSPFYPVASDRTRSIIIAVSRLPLPAPTSPPVRPCLGAASHPHPLSSHNGCSSPLSGPGDSQRSAALTHLRAWSWTLHLPSGCGHSTKNGCRPRPDSLEPPLLPLPARGPASASALSIGLREPIPALPLAGGRTFSSPEASGPTTARRPRPWPAPGRASSPRSKLHCSSKRGSAASFCPDAGPNLDYYSSLNHHLLSAHPDLAT